jgi:hypothetical protein
MQHAAAVYMPPLGLFSCAFPLEGWPVGRASYAPADGSGKGPVRVTAKPKGQAHVMEGTEAMV